MKADFDIYARLYRQYVNELYSYGIGLGYEDGKCMDAIHDIFCKIVISRKDIGEIDNIKLYLFRSLKNRLLDIHKHNRRMMLDNVEKHMFRTEISVIDAIITDEEYDQLVRRVQKLMEELTSTQKEAIYLRYIQEMGYDEIAVLLDINPESVRKLVYRGLEKIRQRNLSLTLLLIIYATIYNMK